MIRTLWSDEDIAKVRELHLAGKECEEIAAEIGRTRHGVYYIIRKLFGERPLAPEPEYVVGPAIGYTHECERIRKDARLGSLNLQIAINDLFCRIANQAGISRNDVMRAYANGGPSPVPGTERICKTSQIERMAA